MDALFCRGDLDATLRQQTSLVREKVEEIPMAQFVNAPDDEIVENVVQRLEVLPLLLNFDQMTQSAVETSVDVSGDPRRLIFGDGPCYVPGIQLTVCIPFNGDAGLFKLKPNQWRMSGFPRANIYTDREELEIILTMPLDLAESLKAKVESEVESLRFYVGAQASQVRAYNSELPNVVRQAVSGRRQRISKLDGIVASIGIPLKRTKSPPVPLKRKLLRPLPPPPKTGVQSEPEISREDYEHILNVIRHEGRTFETTPLTYRALDEEDLRNIMMAHLNGHYEGGATGETFRKRGKTDVRIEDRNRCAFIAEFKIWGGPKELSDAVGQLGGYQTWRDCKAALVLFNKAVAGFTEVLSKVEPIFSSHDRYRRTLQSGKAGEWRFSLTSAEDPGRLIELHVFLFNIYTAEGNKRT